MDKIEIQLQNARGWDLKVFLATVSGAKRAWDWIASECLEYRRRGIMTTFRVIYRPCVGTPSVVNTGACGGNWKI